MARITVVDDYPEFLELVTSVLEDEGGHDVAGLDASETAPEDVARTRPDLLILDLSSTDGVLSRVGPMLAEATGPAPGPTPIIVCSGDVPRLREWADEFAGLANLYPLEKPFTIDVLTDLVERALDSTPIG
jgi:DNA-binding NtrC family response regulator